MPQSAWSDQRERQYEHIKEGLEERGESESVAREIAARTVNKERDQRERQYEHIKEGLEERGESESVAREIAARTVNKERARAGETHDASSESIEDISSGPRGGIRSHRGSGGRTYRQLYAEAKRKGLKGRSEMNKAGLESALSGR